MKKKLHLFLLKAVLILGKYITKNRFIILEKSFFAEAHLEVLRGSGDFLK